MATRRLGRGLDGLLPPAPSGGGGPARGTSEARIEQLHPNRDQPRRHFDDDALRAAGSLYSCRGIQGARLVFNAMPLLHMAWGIGSSHAARGR